MPFYLISTTTLCVTYYGFTLWIRTMGFKRLCYTFLVTGDLSESVIFPNFKCPTFPLHLFACLTLLQRMCWWWSLVLIPGLDAFFILSTSCLIPHDHLYYCFVCWLHIGL